jgi:FkbM family methyltransferase
MISYAQNFEDVILMRCLGHIKDGFYIDIGAGHPTLFSVTRAFYDIGWHGINVEPGATDYALLCKARPRDINLNFCAGAFDGLDNFDIYPKVNDGLNAAQGSLRQRFELDGHQYETRPFTVFSLNSIIENHAPDRTIHFLKIDVEGYEQPVLIGLDLGRHQPWVIVVEATEPHTRTRSDHKWNKLLFRHGYQEVYFDALNCFYLHPDKGAMRSAFSLPPNLFDNFQLPTS